jgi:hypothetical protein
MIIFPFVFPFDGGSAYMKTAAVMTVDGKTVTVMTVAVKNSNVPTQPTVLTVTVLTAAVLTVTVMTVTVFYVGVALAANNPSYFKSKTEWKRKVAYWNLF